MPNFRVAAVLWLLAGLAMVVAALLADRRQTAFFAIAVMFFVVSALTARRARVNRRSL